MLQTTTTDGLATLHFDHETWDLWVDIHSDATPETGAEITLLAGMQGCYVMVADEMEPEHREKGIVRHFMAYTEVAECP